MFIYFRREVNSVRLELKETLLFCVDYTVGRLSVAFRDTDGHPNRLSIHIEKEKVRTDRFRKIKMNGNQRQQSKWEIKRNN